MSIHGVCMCVFVCVCGWVGGWVGLFVIPKYTRIGVLSEDPLHDKPGKRQNRTSQEPHRDPRTENNQPGVTNRACSVPSISTRYAELEKPVPVRPPGNLVLTVSVVS